MLLKIKVGGYPFINSNECIELLDKIRLIEESILSEVGNEQLLLEFQSEMDLHDKRENEMLRNIYNISNSESYNKALLICGVEHRKPLTQKIQEYKSRGKLNLNWIFWSNA